MLPRWTPCRIGSKVRSVPVMQWPWDFSSIKMQTRDCTPARSTTHLNELHFFVSQLMYWHIPNHCSVGALSLLRATKVTS